MSTNQDRAAAGAAGIREKLLKGRGDNVSLRDREREYLRALEIRDEKELQKRKIVLALLQQCKDKGLSISDVNDICLWASRQVLTATLRDGLTLGRTDRPGS